MLQQTGPTALNGWKNKPISTALLWAELSHRRYRLATIAIGTNTDAYQRIEKDCLIIRRLLEVLDAFDHPAGIVTMGTLVERDADILGPMGRMGQAGLTRLGVPVQMMILPIVPVLTDHEIEGILSATADAGAVAASMIALRLPREVADLWRDRLAEHYPDRLRRVMSKLRDMHGGRDYDQTFGTRMMGQRLWADLLRQRFDSQVRAPGLDASLAPLGADLFVVPPKAGDQLRRFGRRRRRESFAKLSPRPCKDVRQSLARLWPVFCKRLAGVNQACEAVRRYRR
jgi:DNA repair photolyase